MSASNHRDYSRNNKIIFISLVASLIAIFAFFTGLNTLQKVLDSIILKLAKHDDTHPIIDTTTTSLFGSEKKHIKTKELDKNASEKSINGSSKRKIINVGHSFKPNTEVMTDLSKYSNIIQELFAISNVNLLRKKLDGYYKRGLIAIGEKDDFENPDGLFVFIFDETKVYRVFLFQNNSYCDVRTNRNFPDLPIEFKDKQQIWAIDSYKLVQD